MTRPGECLSAAGPVERHRDTLEKVADCGSNDADITFGELVRVAHELLVGFE